MNELHNKDNNNYHNYYFTNYSWLSKFQANYNFMKDYIMDKELFDNLNADEENMIEATEEEEDLLINIAHNLTSSQLSYIVEEWMKYNNESKVVSKAWDKSTGSKLLHFRMEAEFGYYLNDL